MNKIGQMMQPLQKQLKSVETRTESIKQIHSQLKQLQKQMSQVQKESQKIRLLLRHFQLRKTLRLKRNRRRPQSKVQICKISATLRNSLGHRLNREGYRPRLPGHHTHLFLI
ncbi:MAG: hypothetical protein WBZ36_21285 [Candidatus Nitrosopolaris sp.]